MKLFHTSDWHLGRMLYGRSLLEDQRHFLEGQFLPAVERERPACVLLAGDLYDRQVAPPEAIALLDKTLSRLVELGVPVCAHRREPRRPQPHRHFERRPAGGAGCTWPPAWRTPSSR